ncbi:MAG TPA: class I SAM-dependent methyltransferase [Chthoniobacterales bacterium]|nr:class I SAM-dependent methyltransferase [Chthoniobacterales bacterium]
MRLAHKLEKLANGSAWRSARRRFDGVASRPRPGAALDPAGILARFDRAELEQICRRYAVTDPGKNWSKYLELPRWLDINLRRARELSLDRGRRRRILDLGCGAGYFLAICRLLGHEILGLDIDDVPMFREMTDALGVDRVIWRIRPSVPLPELGAPFDLITAYLICFNGHKTEALWGVAEWNYFLDDLRLHLTSRGSVCLELNREFNGTHYMPELRQLFCDRGAEVRAYRVFFRQPPRARS